jgi:hypothetical protein
MKQFEQKLLEEGRVSAYNNAVSAFKEALTNARRKIRKLREKNENNNLPDEHNPR